MPLLHHLKFNLYSIVLWHITESEEELMEGINLHSSDRHKFETCKKPLRKAEFLALRQCLREYFGHNPEVFYHPSGKPYLKEDYNISFSHTLNYAGMIISQKLNPGIDLECFRPRVEKIEHKFVRPEEQKTLGDHKIEQLTAYWSAKEVIVKILGNRRLDFKKQIRLEPLLYKSHQHSRAHVFQNGERESFYLLFKNYNDFLLTYGWQEA